MASASTPDVSDARADRVLIFVLASLMQGIAVFE